MSLRWKILIVITLTAVMIIGAVYAISELTFMKSFQGVENQNARQTVERADKALTDDIDSLNTLNHDWAAWNDTYYFVQNPDKYQSYVTDNPTDVTFASAKLNYIFIIDNSNQLVFGKGFNLETGTDVPIPESLNGQIFNDIFTHHVNVTDNVSGIIMLPEGPLMISADPIITSEGKGPIAGTIIMARYLDSAVISEMSATIQSPIFIVNMNATDIPPDFQVARTSLSAQKLTFTHLINTQSIAGYILVQDIYGNPAIILKATMPRDIFAQSVSTMRYFIFSVLGLAILFGFILIYLLSKLVLARVSQVSVYASNIRTSGDLSKRLNTTGNDELSQLTQNLNSMVDTLQQSHQELLVKQQAEERLRLTIESVAEGIASTDLEGKITDVNESKVMLHGYSNKEELLGKNALDLVSPKDLSKARENMKVALETGFSRGGEYVMLKKDGTTFIGERSTALLRNAEGGPIGFVISTKDITERKRAEEEQKLSEQNFRNSLNNSPMGVTIADLEFNTVYANQTFLDIFGYENFDQVKASPPQEHYTQETYVEYLLRKEQRSRGETNPDNIEIEVIRKDGSIRRLQIFLKHVLWDGKQQYQTLYNDITERKQATDQLAKLNEELKSFNLQLETKVEERTRQLEEAVSIAEASNQAKSDFLASMSHELRTPLNAIIGFSQLLHEKYFGELNDKQSEYVVEIVDSGKHLLSLINDILDLSKIEAGKMELDFSEVKIADLLQNSLVMIKEKALAHNISLDLQIAENVDEMKINADERRLKQVMFNLLSNSAKFTPDGGAITISARKEEKELIISVSDTGIGMTPQEQKKLFEAFYQASGGIKGKTPGTGLGLAITKSIVEKHGGKIWMESEGLNKGSKFTFTLPL